ncbi:MAG: hypothetical protein NTV94_13660 [Planctomycetota bacterium]|nr:hypothetical protein [Planctomycetota bacterium]
MARRRKHTAYFVLVAAAAGALAIDRLVLGGGTPASVQAAASPVDSGSNELRGQGLAAAAKPVRLQFEELRSGPLAGKLSELAANDSIAGLLQPRPVVEVAVQSASVLPPTPEPAVSPIIPVLNVTSITIGERSRRAIVNRTVMVVGESMDGAKLIEINTDGLVFEVPGARFEAPLRRE